MSDLAHPMPSEAEKATGPAGLGPVCRHPHARACACSLAVHLLAVLVLAMTFKAVEERTKGLPGLSAAVAEQAAANFEQLDSREFESAETSAVLPSPFEIAGGGYEPVLEFGELQGAETSGPLSGGETLGELADEIAAATGDDGMQGADKPLGNSANFSGVDAEGSDFVFVVDMSGSMSGTRFRRAKSELRRSIEALSPTQRYFIIFFSDDAWPMPADGLLEATEKNLLATRRWLKQAACMGGTHPLPALLDALRLEPDAIFLLSDGQFDPETAMHLDTAEPYVRIPIHTIGFASRAGEPMLKAISEVSGGKYRYVR